MALHKSSSAGRLHPFGFGYGLTTLIISRATGLKHLHAGRTQGKACLKGCPEQHFRQALLKKVVQHNASSLAHFQTRFSHKAEETKLLVRPGYESVQLVIGIEAVALQFPHNEWIVPGITPSRFISTARRRSQIWLRSSCTVSEIAA